MALVSPPPGSGLLMRVRGFVLLLLLAVGLLAAGLGIAELAALPFGGVGFLGSLLIGLLVVAAVLGLLTLFGRRRQARALEKRRAGAGAG
jgi:hypothetical protein